ncbi:uncharacterized protein EI90DRAFT_1302493 [Cantharellus anzutake]|uniref:uncharacterized protein n=1 Tax=Cantharellus anzutake TaxID=1750568 RepID=UPI0019063E38|nr:uncharacterized protein EI90DRAFT_1302493 [Cantharellus anzutake]KAF8342099.1 hypothetical protein EI90DRAFT_1302493 [Cantharellus anzutake]
MRPHSEVSLTGETTSSGRVVKRSARLHASLEGPAGANTAPASNEMDVSLPPPVAGMKTGPHSNKKGAAPSPSSVTRKNALHSNKKGTASPASSVTSKKTASRSTKKRVAPPASSVVLPVVQSSPTTPLSTSVTLPPDPRPTQPAIAELSLSVQVVGSLRRRRPSSSKEPSPNQAIDSLPNSPGTSVPDSPRLPPLHRGSDMKQGGGDSQPRLLRQEPSPVVLEEPLAINVGPELQPPHPDEDKACAMSPRSILDFPSTPVPSRASTPYLPSFKITHGVHEGSSIDDLAGTNAVDLSGLILMENDDDDDEEEGAENNVGDTEGGDSTSARVVGLCGGPLTTSQREIIRDLMERHVETLTRYACEWKKSPETLLKAAHCMVTTKSRRQNGNSWNAFQCLHK